MKFIFQPTLQAAATVKIASELWTRTIQAEFSERKWLQVEENWEELENVVEDNLKELILNGKQLPEKFHQRISAVLESIGIEIKWHIDNYRHYWPKLMAHMEWTTQGMIDNMKVAEFMVEDETISVEERFRIACCSCNEEKIQNLWDLIEIRERSPGYFLYDIGYRKLDELVTMWTSFMHGKTIHLSGYRTCPSSTYTRNECGFEMAILKGHVTAIVYYFRKLTPRLREKYLTPSFIEEIVFGRLSSLVSRGHSNAILFLLLSHMTENQQTRVFQVCPFLILERLTDWPWQDSFMSIAMRVFPFVQNDDYLEFLVCLSQKVVRNHWTYHKIFIEFWCQSPVQLKMYAKESNLEILVLEPLLLSENLNCVDVILLFMTPEEKKKMLLTHFGKNVCAKLITNGDLYSLEFFINQCLMSNENEIVHFKTQFLMSHGAELCSTLKAQNKWNEFKKFISTFFQMDESRNQSQIDLGQN